LPQIGGSDLFRQGILLIHNSISASPNDSQEVKEILEVSRSPHRGPDVDGRQGPKRLCIGDLLVDAHLDIPIGQPVLYRDLEPV
jgi:hypothetical protein